MTNKSLEEQGEELFNGKALEDITLDDVEEFKEAYYEGDPKISDEEYDEIIQKKFDGKDPTLGYDVEMASFRIDDNAKKDSRYYHKWRIQS